MNKVLANYNWDERYLTGNTPWTAHSLLTEVLAVIQACCSSGSSVLEIGCGYGQEAIALAKLGYSVTATDISAAAIAQAKSSAYAENVNINFQTFDILHDESPFESFDLVLDVAVLHIITNSETRCKFAHQVASLLKPRALWVNVSCLSPDVDKVTEATGIKAPPALSKGELQQSSEQDFLLISQQVTQYQICRGGKLAAFPAVVSVFRKKPDTLGSR